MKLIFLSLSALTIGVLGKIDDACTVKSGKTLLAGTCQRKSHCMKSGLATFSKSAFTDSSNSAEELACPDDDEEVQCCVEIKCGSNKCRNNVEENKCVEGSYVPNFRDRSLCPSSSLEDNVQCCVEHIHTALKRRQDSSASDSFSTDASSLGDVQQISASDVGWNTDNVGSSAYNNPMAVENSYNPGANLPSPSSFQPVQIGSYQQGAVPSLPQTPPQQLPPQGTSFGLNSQMSPQLKYTDGSVSVGIGPTASVPSMVTTGLRGGDMWNSFTSGFQGSVNIGLKKIKRWWPWS